MPFANKSAQLAFFAPKNILLVDHPQLKSDTAAFLHLLHSTLPLVASQEPTAQDKLPYSKWRHPRGNLAALLTHV